MRKGRFVTVLSAGLALLQAFSSISYAGFLFLPFNQFYVPVGYVGSYPGHAGTDYRGAGYGTPVYAAYAGTVMAMRETENDGCDITWDQQWNYGNYVKIDHQVGAEKYRTEYWHLKQYGVEVNVGDNVSVGDLIAYVSNSGLTFGSDCAKRADLPKGAYFHLHFEVKKLVNGSWVVVDPYNPWLWTSNPPQPATLSGGASSPCTDFTVGTGSSSRPQVFIDAYNRNGGYAALGCPYNATHGQQINGYRVVEQDLVRADGFHSSIIHDEGSDNPPGSVPAYLVHGWARDFYLNYGSPPSLALGVPVSDELTNSFGHRQQNFSRGFIWRDAGRSQTNASFYNNVWYWLDRGGDYSLSASFAPAEGGGVRLVLDGQGGTGSWVRSAWVAKDISDVPVTQDLRVVWEQFDRAHMLFFGLVIRGADGADRPLFYSHDGYYWTWKQFARNVFEDFKTAHGVDPVSIKELRVGHYLYDPWVGDVGGTVRNIVFDYASPQTSLTMSPAEPDGQEEWYITSPQLTLIATDDASGVGRIEYDLGSGWQTYSSPFVISQEGETSIKYRSVDRAGRVEQINAQNIKIDKAAPQTNLSTDGPRYESEDGKVFVSSKTEFELTADDANPINPTIETSGVEETTYRYGEDDDSEEQTFEEPFSLEGKDGEYAVEYGSADVAGNTEPLNSQTFYLDSTPLVSSDDSDGQWSNTDVTVTITAQDPVAPDGTAGSGVQKIVYSEEEEVPGNQTQVTFTEEGTHGLSYFAVDNVENVEEEKQAEPIKIDKTPPDITGAPTNDPNENGWYNEDVTAHFEATDQEHLSGVKSVTPDVVISTEGTNQEVTGIAEDNAGNIATTTVVGINIDKTPPESVLDPLEPYYDTLPIDLDYNSFDNLSSVDRARLYKSYQGGDWEYHPGSSREPDRPFVVGTLDEGRWEFSSCAVDKADNEECDVHNVESVNGAQTSTIYDITAPRTIMVKPPANGNDWYNLDIEVVLEVTDEHLVSPEIETSGVSQTAVIVFKDGEPFASDIYQKWDIALPFEEDGIYVVAFYSEDRAGNVEDPGSTTVQLDKTKPTSEVTSLEQGAFYNAQTWPGLAGLASDNLSGVFQVEVRIDKDGGEGDWEAAEGGEEWIFEGFGFEDGFYTVYSRATDNAGNQEHTFRVTFVYDAAPPITSVNLGGSRGQSGWHISPVSLNLTAEDATAGVAQTFYRFEGSDPKVYQEPVASANGVHKVEVWSIDRAGNEEKHQFLTFRVDTIAPPAPTASVAGGSFFVGEQVVISLTGEEGTSVFYLANGEGPTLYVAPLLISSDNLLAAYAVDEAGNKSGTSSWVFDFQPHPALPVSSRGGSQPQILGVEDTAQNELVEQAASAPVADSGLLFVSAIATFLLGIFERIGRFISQILEMLK